MCTTRLFYARALLKAGGMQTGPEYEFALISVMTGEDSTAGWNPMDTTLPRPDAKPYNTFGPGGAYHVWDYPTAEEGVGATISTLRQANMAPFYDLMCRASQTAEQLTRAFAKTPWGGLGDVLPLEIVQAWRSGMRDHVTDRQQLVHGSGPWPYRPDGSLMG